MSFPIPDRDTSGILSTLGFSNAEIKKHHWISKLYMLEPTGQISIGALGSRLKANDSTNSVRYDWMVDRHITQQYKATAALAGTTATGIGAIIGEKARNQLVTGQVLENDRTSERMRVMSVDASVDTATAVVVARGKHGTTAAAILLDDYFTVVGSSFEEGSLAPTTFSHHRTQMYNYTTIFRKSWEITNSAQKDMRLLGGENKYNMIKMQQMKMLASEVDLSFFRSPRYNSEITGTEGNFEPDDFPELKAYRSGQIERTSGGLDYFITKYCPENVIDASPTANTVAGHGQNDHFGYNIWNTNAADSGLTYLAFTKIAEKIFQTGGPTRLAICGLGALSELQKLLTNSDGMRYTKVETGKIGFNLTEVMTPHGSIYFTSYQGFTWLGGNWANRCYIIDPTDIGRVMYRPMFIEENIQENGSDRVRGAMTEEMGWIFKNPGANLRIDNFKINRKPLG